MVAIFAALTGTSLFVIRQAVRSEVGRQISEATESSVEDFRRIQHQVAVRARFHHGAQHRDELRRLRPRMSDQGGLRLEDRGDRPQSVRTQRASRRNQVDDRVRETEPRRDLDRPGHVHELDVDGQELARDAREDGGDGRTGEILDAFVVGLLRHRDVDAARAEPQLEQLLDARPALAHQILAGDAAIDDAVLHVLGDVGGAHEEYVDGRVAAREGERALARLLGTETRVFEQRNRGLTQSPLDGDGDPQAAVARFRRSSAKR